MKKNENIDTCLWADNNYYLLTNDYIECYDESFNCLRKIDNSSKFTCMSYDNKEKLFYLAKRDSQEIYISSNLAQFNTFKISSKCKEEIVNITYCKCYHSLLIITKSKIFIYDLCHKHLKVLFEVKQNLCQVNDCMGELGCNLGCKISLISAVCCCKDIYVAYQRNGVYYISTLINEKLDCELFESSNEIKSIFVKCHEVWALIDCCQQCEVVYTGIDCSEDCPKYHECKCEIISSIASIEKSLAEILCSESLKIKAAIQKSEDITDLICVNSSVKEIIYYITVLEFLLTEKIRTIKSDDCCNPGCCDD